MARRYNFRRRRKPVEWVRTSVENNVDTFHTSLFYDGTNSQVIDVSNIVIGDAPYVTDSLVEERKTFTIDRIVGHIRAVLNGQSAEGTGAAAGPIRWRWGLFVGEVDESGNLLDLDRWDLFTTAGHEVDWIMRDDYILGQSLSPGSSPYPSVTPFNQAAWQFPPISSKHQAPWGIVDTKAKRHVGQEQRLFLQNAITKADNAFDYALVNSQ